MVSKGSRNGGQNRIMLDGGMVDARTRVCVFQGLQIREVSEQRLPGLQKAVHAARCGQAQRDQFQDVKFLEVGQ